MRFFFSLFTLWATCLGLASGFELAGAYERVMSYYSYVADCRETKNNPNKIGRGCAKAPKVCTFDQFMEYILVPSQTVNIHNKGHDDLPDIDATAKKLFDAKLTGAVDIGRTFHGADQGPKDDDKDAPETNKWAVLLGKTADYIAFCKMYGDLPDKLMTGMIYSLKQVHAQRVEASVRQWEVDNPTRKIVTKTMKTFGIEYKTRDMAKTIAANPGWQDAETTWETTIRGGHFNNIKSLATPLVAISKFDKTGVCT